MIRSYQAGLVPSDNKALPKPMLTKLYYIMVSLGLIELTQLVMDQDGWDTTDDNYKTMTLYENTDPCMDK